MSTLRMILTGSCMAIALASGQALAEDCEKPERPVIPDGSTATEAELVEAQGFFAKNEAYRNCLDEKINSLKASHEDAPDEEKAAIAKMHESMTSAYNAAVDAEHDVGEEFNAAVRAFKAKGN